MGPDRERMLDLIVRWEEAKAQGQDPRPEEFCGDCAELLSGFRRQVEKLGDVEWLNGPIEVAATTPGERLAVAPRRRPAPAAGRPLPARRPDRRRAASGGSTGASTPGWSGRWP